MNNVPKCPYCQKVEAKWVYMPNGEYACDDCVPRKCSCNMEPMDGDWENEKHLPCCEWEWIEEI